MAERAGLYFSVFMLISPAILFFLWTAWLALKNEADNTSLPPVFFPDSPPLDSFADVFTKNDFMIYTIDSVIVSFSATGLVRRGAAGRAKRSGAGRGRIDLAGVPLRRDAAGAPEHHRCDDPGFLTYMEQFRFRRVTRGPIDPDLASGGLQRAALRANGLGPLAAVALVVAAPVLLTLLMKKEIVAGLTTGA